MIGREGMPQRDSRIWGLLFGMRYDIMRDEPKGMIWHGNYVCRKIRKNG